MRRIDTDAVAKTEPVMGVVLRRMRVLTGIARYKATMTGRVFRDGARCIHETPCSHNMRPGCWNETFEAETGFKPTVRQKLRYLITGRFD